MCLKTSQAHNFNEFYDKIFSIDIWRMIMKIAGVRIHNIKDFFKATGKISSKKVEQPKTQIPRTENKKKPIETITLSKRRVARTRPTSRSAPKDRINEKIKAPNPDERDAPTNGCPFQVRTAGTTKPVDPYLQKTNLSQVEIDALQGKHNPSPPTPVHYPADSLQFNSRGEIIALMKDEATHERLDEIFEPRPRGEA
jgi:hypothetical protein